MHVLLYSLSPTLQLATTNPHLCWRLLYTHGQVWVSLLWGHCSFFLGLVHTKFCLCPPRVYFPDLCKFWQLYGEVNGNLLQEGLGHTQVCCTQRPYPCGSPLLTRTSTGDTQTQFCLSLCQSLTIALLVSVSSWENIRSLLKSHLDRDTKFSKEKYKITNLV